jgi:DNA-binding MarR family transcriptional regulator
MEENALNVEGKSRAGYSFAMNDVGPDRLDASLIALRRILRATEIYARKLAAQVGMTSSQLRVLQIIAGKPGAAAKPKELATQMRLSQGTITALVDKLQAQGQVVRVRSETDRRQTDVTLTAAGRATVDNAPDALQQRYVNAFLKLDDWEQAQLVASLERVAAMLDADAIDASPVLTVGDIHAG